MAKMHKIHIRMDSVPDVALHKLPSWIWRNGTGRERKEKEEKGEDSICGQAERRGRDMEGKWKGRKKKRKRKGKEGPYISLATVMLALGIMLTYTIYNIVICA